MKKILLSLFAIMMAVSSFAELKTVKFDMSNPEACGWTGGLNKAIAATGLKIGDIAINVTVDATPALQKVRFAKSGDATVLKFSSNCAISIETAEGNIRSIKFDGTNLAADDVTVDAGSWAAGAWSGQAQKIIFTQVGAAADIKSIEVTYQVADQEDPRTLGEAESYISVKAIQGDPQLNEDGTAKLDGYGNPMYNYSYEFSPEFAEATVADGKLVVEYKTTHITGQSVAGATAKTCDATSVTEWNDMKFELKNHLNDNTSNLHLGVALGTGNPVFGYEIEEVWTDGLPTGTYRQCFNKQNPAYDPAAAYAAKQAGETYDVPQYLEEKYYYWKPGCGMLPAQGLYHKYTADVDGQLKVFIWVNKGNRNTYVIDEKTIEPVSFKVEGYMNNQTENLPDPTDPEKTVAVKKFLTNADIEVLNDPAKPYVIAGTQASGQVFWGNVIYNISAGQTIWIFQESSQIGFHGFEFRPFVDPSGIQNVETSAVSSKVVKTIKNGAIVIEKAGNTYNVAGQLVK